MSAKAFFARPEIGGALRIRDRLILAAAVSIGALLFFAAQTASAKTLYVNADSNGSHASSTVPFNDPAYDPDDSFATLDLALAAASAGDVIEISGGAHGKTYAGPSAAIAKSVTIRGSRISGFSGPVTVTVNSARGYAIGMNADGMTLDRLTLAGEGTAKSGGALTIWKNGATIKNIHIKNIPAGAYGILVKAGAPDNLTAISSVVIESEAIGSATSTGRGGTGPAGIGFAGQNQGKLEIANCTISVSGSAIHARAGDVADLKNCSIAGTGYLDERVFWTEGSGEITTSHSLITGFLTRPQEHGMSPGWKSSSSDMINGFPGYRERSPNVGFISLSTDDSENIDYFSEAAGYAMSKYGIRMSFYANYTNRLTEDQKKKLQTLYKAGHEIGVHTRDHTDFTFLDAFNIRYDGSLNGVELKISSKGTKLELSGAGATRTLVLSDASSTMTIGEVCETIGGWDGFVCELSDAHVPKRIPAFALKDGTIAIEAHATSGVPFDTDMGADNRYFSYEIAGSIADLEAALREDPACASFKAETIALPFHGASKAVLAWIRAHTDLIGIRQNDRVGNEVERGWLGAINAYDAMRRVDTVHISGPGYSDLGADAKLERLRQGARDLAAYASEGLFTGTLSHNPTLNFSIPEYEAFVDELAKYNGVNGIRIDTLGNMISEIRSSGAWSSAGNGIWKRSFADEDDFRPSASSALIDAGEVIEGRTSDILGNPIVGAPDIGAYEYSATGTDPDGNAPVIMAFAVASSSDSLTVPIASLSASGGAIAFFFAESNAAPSSTDAGWGMATSSFAFASAGTKTLFAWAKDADGNVSESASSTVVIALASSTDPGTSTSGSSSGSSGGSSGGGGGGGGGGNDGFHQWVDSTTSVAATSTVSTSTLELLDHLVDFGVTTNTLVKLPDDRNPATQNDSIVYYVGDDGMRHVFPNEKAYFTWYPDFSNVGFISAASLASINLGKNVVYKPGVRMVKFQTDPKCYAVAAKGILRWIKTETIARELYGTDWNKKIDDISDAFFTNYAFGTDIASSTDYNPAAERDAAKNISLEF